VCGACGCCLFSDWLAVGVTSPDPSRPPFLHRHLYLSSSFFMFGIWRDSFRDSYDGILRHAYLFIYFLFGSKEKKEKSRKIRNVVWRPRRNLMIINIKKNSRGFLPIFFFCGHEICWNEETNKKERKKERSHVSKWRFNLQLHC